MRGPRLQVALLVPEVITREMLVSYLSDVADCELVIVGASALGSDEIRPEVLVVAGDMLADGVQNWPGVPLLALLDGPDPRAAARALRQGAGGVVNPESTLEELTEAIRMVSQGNTWLPPSQVSEVLKALAEGDDDLERMAVLSLTQRERHVMLLIGQGLDRQQIAEQLFVSGHTVRTHIQNVLRKLGVHSQVAIAATARTAVKAGWIAPTV